MVKKTKKLKMSRRINKESKQGSKNGEKQKHKQREDTVLKEYEQERENKKVAYFQKQI